MSADERPAGSPSPQHRARRLLDEAQNMTVATVDADGTPWVSPVFYVPDEHYDLFWTSESTARHSVNVRSTGVAAIVISEPDPGKRVDAVYMTAEVLELGDREEIVRAMAVMAAKPQPEQWMINSITEVSGDGPWRIYRAHPRTMDVRATEQARGKAVARREPADFRV